MKDTWKIISWACVISIAFVALIILISYNANLTSNSKALPSIILHPIHHQQSKATNGQGICDDCNIILITVDALRPDHLGCYNYFRDTSPNVDLFSKNAVVFDDAVTVRAKTNPSIASMLTGLYPYEHGVRQVYVPLVNARTLPIVLNEYGYTTIGVVSNYVLNPISSGLGKYFNVYDSKEASDGIKRKAEEINAAAFNQLDAHKGEKFFMWLHYMDPHGPYLPPEEYRGFYTHSIAEWLNKSYVMDYHYIVDAPMNGTMLDALYYVDQYDGEIHYFDGEFGLLLEKLRLLQLLNNTVIIFTADHGEALDDFSHKDFFEHGELYEDNIRIPLIIRFPQKTYAGVRVTQFVTNMDLYPTILDIVGVPLNETGKIEGVDMMSAIKGGAIREEAFIERKDDGAVTFFTHAGVRRKNTMLIYNGPCEETALAHCRPHEYECYDLRSDPNESNESGCLNETAEKLHGSLAAYIDAANKLGRMEAKDMGSYNEEKLKSLGYV